MTNNMSDYIIAESYRKGIESYNLKKYNNSAEYLGECIIEIAKRAVIETYDQETINKIKNDEGILNLCNHNSLIWLQSNEKELILKAINKRIHKLNKESCKELNNIIRKIKEEFEQKGKDFYFEYEELV